MDLTSDDPHRLFDDRDLLGSAREWLRVQAMNKGATCPCCQQFSRRYKRTIHRSMAHDLITFYRRVGVGEWGHVRTALGHDGGDFAKLGYWELIEERGDIRPDGSDRAGWWRITGKGESWVRNRIGVPRHAVVYAGRLLRFEGREDWTIRRALGKAFDYDELMST